MDLANDKTVIVSQGGDPGRDSSLATMSENLLTQLSDNKTLTTDLIEQTKTAFAQQLAQYHSKPVQKMCLDILSATLYEIQNDQSGQKSDSKSLTTTTTQQLKVSIDDQSQKEIAQFIYVCLCLSPRSNWCPIPNLKQKLRGLFVPHHKENLSAARHYLQKNYSPSTISKTPWWLIITLSCIAAITIFSGFSFFASLNVKSTAQAIAHEKTQQ